MAKDPEKETHKIWEQMKAEKKKRRYASKSSNIQLSEKMNKSQEKTGQSNRELEEIAKKENYVASAIKKISTAYGKISTACEKLDDFALVGATSLFMLSCAYMLFLDYQTNHQAKQEKIERAETIETKVISSTPMADIEPEKPEIKIYDSIAGEEAEIAMKYTPKKGAVKDYVPGLIILDNDYKISWIGDEAKKIAENLDGKKLEDIAGSSFYEIFPKSIADRINGALNGDSRPFYIDIDEKLIKYSIIPSQKGYKIYMRELPDRGIKDEDDN